MKRNEFWQNQFRILLQHPCNQAMIYSPNCVCQATLFQSKPHSQLPADTKSSRANRKVEIEKHFSSINVSYKKTNKRLWKIARKRKHIETANQKKQTVRRQQKHLLSKCPTSKAVKGNVDKFGKYEIWQRRSAPHAVTEIGMSG